MSRTLQGKFRPYNPDKYKGDPSNIVYRSSWERAMMNWLDLREDIIWWSSEEKCLWYDHPFKKRKARYFPDFIIHYKDKQGIERTEMIEVKPKNQVKGPPANPKRKTQAWVNAVQTYIVNQKKWEAARTICEDRGWGFRLITEDDLKM